jgi:hypothetical protein
MLEIFGVPGTWNATVHAYNNGALYQPQGTEGDRAHSGPVDNRLASLRGRVGRFDQGQLL